MGNCLPTTSGGPAKAITGYGMAPIVTQVPRTYVMALTVR